MSFVYQRTVRFAEVDAAKVMYFSRAYEVAHEVFEELMAAAGYPPGETFEQGEWGMPLVHTEADYKGPWRMGERMHVSAAIVESHGRTVCFEYCFKDDSGRQRTRVAMRHAFVTLKTFRATDPPDGLIAAIKALLA
jgi:acyl-CoA thioesterase FadM